MGRRTLTRHFKHASERPIVTWLNNERLRYAAELLEVTDYSVDKIAESAGFNTAVLFRKLFKSKYGRNQNHWYKKF
ncbi:helix-turn-helix domain-containing protein [Acinetobacter sp. YH12023]|uniref:helix-turn-helix domain-containing protein n=1 Tax=Acinetobacter sp. YH12023 TaxID=2601041 RepID=UPI0015D2A0F6